MTKFTDFPLRESILKALDKLGYTTPTEIQEKSLPILLQTGRVDFHGQAQTGTGKTLAFGIPLLHHVDMSNKNTQALIVAPTRELVVQIHQSIQAIADQIGVTTAAVYGGVAFEPQRRSLKKGTQIVIGTPGRLNDHLRRKTLILDDISTVVLDEADIMLDMGFKEEVEEILTYTNENRNIWLLSATVKPGVEYIKRKYMQNPALVCLSKQNVTSDNIAQYSCVVPFRYKQQALCRFIANTQDFYGFIFCQTKIQTSELAEKLIELGYSANAIHGDMSQVNRNRVIEDFKNKKFKILVATDVAARGIDVSSISHVINFECPEDQESYVHRAGRTGRAGKQGVVITLVDPRHQYALRSIANRFKLTITPIEIPSVQQLLQQQVKKAVEFAQQEKAVMSKEAHVTQLAQELKQLPAETQENLLLALMQEKFFSHIDTREIVIDAGRQPSSSSPRYERGGGRGERSFGRRGERRDAQEGVPNGCAELFVNLGQDDGIKKEDIIRQLTNSKTIARDQIMKIRIIKKRSFIVMPAQKAQDIVNNQATALKGRTWRMI